MEHKRTITLQCPTCGGSDFENGSSNDPTALLECVSCHRTTSRDQLIDDNAENIEHQKQELTQEVVGGLKKDFEATLRNAFRGSKNLKIK
ncbi:ECs_2282 family putative zinc-binding protein [Roseateles sp. PN1]|uniref:ECs_2282 family putative zinc-binding protein n=1 Tax=Roseateles sp. PN1 TaxID=3137372 RepID=UPI0031396A6A